MAENWEQGQRQGRAGWSGVSRCREVAMQSACLVEPRGGEGEWLGASGARVTAVVVFLFSKHTPSMFSAAWPGKWGWGMPSLRPEGHLQHTSAPESSSDETPVTAHHSISVKDQHCPRGP